MKLQRKTLALMVGIACSGLLYGINANASSVDGFDDAANSLSSIESILKPGTALDSTATNLSVDDSTINTITTNVAGVKSGAIDNFSTYQDAAIKSNTVNKAWYAAFHDYLDGDKTTDTTSGLLGKLSTNLKQMTPTLTQLSIAPDGTVDKHGGAAVSSKAEASETLLTLIELAQKARDEDTAKGGGETTAFDAFLKDNSANLRILGISKDAGDGKEGLEATVAKTTFMHLVDDIKIKVDGEDIRVPVKQIRENMGFLKNAYSILEDDIAKKVVMDVQDEAGASIIVTPDNSAKLSTVATLSSDLKDGNDVIVASKGTKVSIKGNEITYDTKTYNNDSKQSLVFSNGKFNKLGVVDISNSNIQGAGNTVVAKSEAVFNDKGDLVNPADGITVLGNNNTIESDGIAIGNGNTVTENSIVVGNHSETRANNAIALGNKATVLKEAENSIALGSGSVASRPNEINVGMWTMTKAGENETLLQTGKRNISGVADATELHDAVNLKQLNEVKEASALDATTKATQAVETSKTYTNEQIKTAGTTANAYTDKQVSGLKQEMNGKIDALDKKVNKGFAANAALSGLFQPYGVGKINMTAGVGGYQSESAVAVGVGYRVNENVAIKGGIATAVGNGSSTMYNASVNFEW